MTGIDNTSQALQLRPTLIIGLGGSGYQVAVQLKARLVEAFGSEAGYDDAVKFLCLDTANENFTARQPNHPERPPVGLSRGREFVRISDVPLQELMEKRNKMLGESQLTGVYRHLPKTLRSSHIDQGAQQIRRLGRIALFHRYKDVKEKLSPLIRDLLKMRDSTNRSEINLKIEQRQRLRVYIVCSICGGTGSGTFIDMAYITRYLAQAENLPPQNVDIVAMLMLPEAFPNVNTTGSDRIRANACAALLDLEYYNQDLINEDTIYHEDFGIEQVTGRSKPYNIVYLVGGSNSESRTVDGVKEIAPLLADSIFMMISSRVGEQLDATLDNIKVVTTQYHEDGHRRLYSGLGISQISYPTVWLQQRFMKEFQKWLIRRYAIPSEFNPTHVREAAEAWFRLTRNTVQEGLRRSMDEIVQPLLRLEQTIGGVNDPLQRLRRAFRESEDLFREQYLSWLESQGEENSLLLRRQILAQVQQEINATIDADAIDEAKHRGGLLWTRAWLDALYTEMYNWVNDSRREQRGIDFDTAINRSTERARQANNVIGFVETQQRRRAVAQEANSLRDFFQRTAKEIATDETLLHIFSDLLPVVQELRQQVDSAVEYWEQNLGEAEQASERPISTVSTLNIMDDRELQNYLARKLAAAQRDDIKTSLRNRLGEVGERNPLLGGMALALDSRYHEALTDMLATISRRQYDIQATETIVQLLERLPSNQRKDLISEMQVKGAPLLRYEEGALSAYPPPSFRVIGIRSRDEDSYVMQTDISSADASYVSTEDPSRIVYLHTQHGIPLSALQNYRIYYDQYRRFAMQPDMILHISNELERAPYNPASVYFINKNSLRLLFMRALAYGWLNYIESERCFAYAPEFGEKLREALQQHIDNLSNEFSRYDYTFSEYGERLSKLELDYMTALYAHLSEKEVLHHPMPYLRPNNWEGAVSRVSRGETAIYQDNRAPLQWANSLRLAVTCLVNSPLQTFPRVFEQAFQKLYVEEFNTDNQAKSENILLRTYLSQFGAELVDEQTIQQFSSGNNRLISGNPSDTALQQRMLLQLAAYELTETRIRRQLTEVAYYWQ